METESDNRSSCTKAQVHQFCAIHGTVELSISWCSVTATDAAALPCVVRQLRHANASRQFARLWSESAVQREVRQRSRHSRRVTRGRGGRREVLRRRLQARMLLRQQKEQGSRIQWQEPLQLKAHHLEMLIKALRENAQIDGTDRRPEY